MRLGKSSEEKLRFPSRLCPRLSLSLSAAIAKSRKSHAKIDHPVYRERKVRLGCPGEEQVAYVVVLVGDQHRYFLHHYGAGCGGFAQEKCGRRPGFDGGRGGLYRQVALGDGDERRMVGHSETALSYLGRGRCAAPSVARDRGSDRFLPAGVWPDKDKQREYYRFSDPGRFAGV